MVPVPEIVPPVVSVKLLPVVLPMVLAACGGGYGGQYGSAPVALIPAPRPYQAAAPGPTAGTGRVAILLPGPVRIP